MSRADCLGASIGIHSCIPCEPQACPSGLETSLAAQVQGGEHGSFLQNRGT